MAALFKPVPQSASAIRESSIPSATAPRCILDTLSAHVLALCQMISTRTPATPPAAGSAADAASAHAPAGPPRTAVSFAAHAAAASPAIHSGGSARIGCEAPQPLRSRRTRSSVSSTVISSTGGRLWPALNTSLPTRAIFSLPTFESSNIW